MNATVPTMMELTEPHEIGCGFDPGTNTVWVGDAGVILFKPREVDAVLQAELNVGVMKLKTAATLREVIPVGSYGALGRVFGALTESLKVLVVRIALTWGMSRVVHRVLMCHGLIVSVSHY